MVGMGLGTGLEVKKIWQRGASRAANLRNRGMAAQPCFLNAPNQLYAHLGAQERCSAIYYDHKHDTPLMGCA